MITFLILLLGSGEDLVASKSVGPGCATAALVTCGNLMERVIADEGSVEVDRIKKKNCFRHFGEEDAK